MNNILQLIIACAIIVFTIIIAFAIYITNDRILMAKNIEQAIAKGIDPISVKCSYQTHVDPICITYSMKK